MSDTQSSAGTSTLSFAQFLGGILVLANGTALPAATLDDPTLGTVTLGPVSGDSVPFVFAPTGLKAGTTTLHFEFAGVDFQPGDLTIVVTEPPPPPPAETASIDPTSLVIAAWDGTSTPPFPTPSAAASAAKVLS